MDEENKKKIMEIFKQWWFYVIIALVVVVIILVIVLATGNKNNNVDNKNTSNNTFETSSNSNSSFKDATVDKIKIEKVGIAKNGDFVIKITNNNNGPACISEISVDFKNKDGVFELSKSAYEMFFVVPAGGTTYNYVSDYDNIDFSKYPNFQFNCELAGDIISRDQVYNGIELQANDVNKKLAVTLKNNSGKAIKEVDLIAVYYKNNEIVGVEDGHIYNKTIKNGSEGYTNIDYATDRQYDDVAFDKYEVYFLNATIDKSQTNENDPVPNQTQGTISTQLQSKEQTEQVTPTSIPSTTTNNSSSSTTNNSLPTTTNNSSSAGLSSDFKKAMDSYEEFMNDYVEFMKKYKDNPNDFTLLADYAKYIEKYSNVAKDFENWKSDNLNAEELAYYTQVQTRVWEKISAIE